MKIDPAPLHDFATRYTATWCSQHPARVAAFFSPTGSISANGAAPAVGRSAVSEFAKGFISTFPDLQVALDNRIIEDGHAVYHWTLTGTNSSPGGTRRRAQISGFEVWAVGPDGLIA